MSQKSYADLRKDLLELTTALTTNSLEGKLGGLNGKVITLAAIMAQVIEKLDKEMS